MPCATEHRGQAQHNLRFVAEPVLDPSSTAYHDWLVTVCFYAALHLIDERLDAEEIDPINHDERDHWVESLLEQKYKGIWGKYSYLKRHSFKARYNCEAYDAVRSGRALEALRWIEKVLSAAPETQGALEASGP